MKVLMASTPEQEEEIQDLVHYMYGSIFPDFFSDEEIAQFEDEWQVLHIRNENYGYVGTMQEALQIITSLHTIICIIESKNTNKTYAEMFQNNVETLQNFGIFFPFSFDQFMKKKVDQVSIYTKPTNQLLI